VTPASVKEEEGMKDERLCKRTSAVKKHSPPAFFFSSKPNFRRSAGCDRSLCVFRFTAFRKADMADGLVFLSSGVCGAGAARQRESEGGAT
jgi:hypothetical protein